MEMIKEMIQSHINGLFKELEDISKEIAETQKRMASIIMRLEILSNVGKG